MGGFVGNLFGGQSTPTQANTQVYQPSGTGTQDTNLNTLLNQNTNSLTGSANPYSQLSPQILAAFSQLFNNPGTAGLNTASTNAGTQFTNAGTAATGAAPTLQTGALSLLPGAAQVMQQGLDPQNALYGQQLQLTNDQANVANAQYGLTGQQAANTLNQADTNFNIDWQNNQLSRSLQALSGAGTAVTQAGSGATSANNLATSGAQSTLAGGNVPYTAQQTIGGNQETALQDYITQLLGPTTSDQATIADLAQYLGLGINASSAGASQAATDYGYGLQNAANTGNAIGGIADIGLTLAGF